MRKQKNFARFYALLKNTHGVDQEDLKITLVRQYTAGRTESLRDMTTDEYSAMCDSIDPRVSKDLRSQMALKRERSSVLRRMQKLGVETSDWSEVDKFTSQPRIAGKRFSMLSLEELRALSRKLIAISKKSTAKEQPAVEPITKEPQEPITDEQVYSLLLVSRQPLYCS